MFILRSKEANNKRQPSSMRLRSSASKKKTENSSNMLRKNFVSFFHHVRDPSTLTMIMTIDIKENKMIIRARGVIKKLSFKNSLSFVLCQMLDWCSKPCPSRSTIIQLPAIQNANGQISIQTNGGLLELANQSTSQTDSNNELSL